ncbi:hypothetical protein [Cellulosimicrobium sp. Marseille-Q4280]|uniref:hypothetical protein n=1 Tax=Cellulosimicrobium sp. Marseille-Q4280 TaxID=2937992 RepID=UPI00203DB7CE|nr:hypothetical protein [Cellulosimicrobium sp. Marseille-Q4280]
MTDVEYLPLTGDSAALHGTAAALARARDALGVAGDELSRVRAAVAPQRGDAVALALGRLDDLTRRASTQGAVLDAAARVLHGQADLLLGRQLEAAAAIARRRSALDDVHRRDAELDALHRAPFLETWGAAHGSALGDAARRVAEAHDEVRRAEEDWRAAREAKQAESRRAAAQLGPLTDVRAVSAWIASGGQASAFRTTWSGGGATASAASTLSGLAAATLVDRLAARGLDDDGETAAVEELARVVGAAGTDEAFWSAFYATTPPGDLYVLLEGGHLRPDGSVLHPGTHHGAIALAVAGTFGPWASSLAPEEQEALGAAVVDDLGTVTIPVGWSATATALLGAAHGAPRVHRGALERLDAQRQADAASPDPLAALSFERDGRFVMSAALSGLAGSPEESLRFLAGDADHDLVAARSALWVGAVPLGGWPDEGEGVAAVVRAAVEHGAASPSETDRESAALLLSRVTWDAPRGLAAVSLSPTAQTDLAAAYAPYVEAFDTSFAAQQPFDAVGVYVGPPRPDGSGGRTLPLLEPDALSRTLSATMASADGVRSWTATMLAHHDATVVDALGPTPAQPDPTDPELRTGVVRALDAHDKALSDAGVIVGSMHRADVASAVDAAERYESRIGFLMGVLGDVAPGAAVLTTPALAVVEGHLVDLDSGLTTTVDRASAEGTAESTVLRSRAHDLVVAALVADGVPPEDAADRAAPFVRTEDGADRSGFGAPFQQAADLAPYRGTSLAVPPGSSVP